MTFHSIATAPVLRTPGFPHRAVVNLARMIAVHRQRRSLAALDDHLLRDIGLTRAEAEVELGRPVWQAPPHWFR